MKPSSASPEERRKKRLALAAAAVFLLFFILVAWVVGRPMVRFVKQPELFRQWVDSHGLLGRLVFLGMMLIQIIIALIPGEPMEIGAGYAFGFWEGTLLCLLGIAIGSALVFLLVRRFGTRLVEVFFPQEKIQSLRFLHQSKKRDLLIFIVLFIPGTPKDLLSYFAGLTDIPLRRWVLIATAARLPSVLTSTAGGSAVGERNYFVAVAVFLSTLAISALGMLIYRKICDRRSNK